MGNHRAHRRDSRRDTSVTPPVVSTAGKRRAVKQSGPRSPLRALPSAPVLVGVAALAISAGGAVSASDTDLIGTTTTATSSKAPYAPANALSGAGGISRVSSIAERQAAVSRDSRRDALKDAADDELSEALEAQNAQRNVALQQLAKQAESQAAKIAENAWVLPVTRYRLTNTFGMARSYYSSGYHTGLDFAAPSGTPIMSIANGVVTEVGYDGSYGNKVVVTLEDGTELWFAHMSAFGTTTGSVVRAGEVIGYVGSTGNSTGPHVHVEVRPGAGDPVDPYQAFVVNGITP
ncbi:M23 family metallopeptidase [Nocardioides sp.]|uniref:M23 family metallopeptidase n=1 Tax=Nocardioides sp. TaxID=35761 RepID=UPI00273644F9|nr:M23 family metallopeptidase [Nocardioides sp.]MDP3889914.1 M23 family metallopeptidase [Nocardioides sp.]